MTPLDHAIYREWLDLEAEGELGADEARRLAEHLGACAGCRAERGHGLRLREALAEARVEVRPGFAGAVMAALPEAAWESAGRPVASRAAWRWAAALLAVFGLASAALLGAGGGALAPGAPLLGSLGAVAALLGASLVAGAGLLGASWAGAGLVLGELLVLSPGTAVGLGFVVLFLLLLAASLMRRPRPAAATAVRPRPRR